MTDVNINFKAPPTCADFMRSEAFFRLIAGPVGSSKTTTCIFEMLRRCMEQAKAPDGFRYTRWAIVRQTLKQLEDTVLKDIEQWLNGLVEYKVQKRTIHMQFGDVRSEWLLLPLDDPEDVKRLLSMQLTGGWMSECIEMDPAVIAGLSGRCGRYPNATMGGCSWRGLIADTNFPIEGGDWHRLMEIDTPADWQIFKQPGGMEPDAENLDWLEQTPETLKLPEGDPARRAQGRKYYERIIATNSNNPAYIERYVHARYGQDPSGSAVFKDTFKRSFHVPRDPSGADAEITPVPGYPLLVSQDFGRNPCALICQVDHKGRLLILEEVVSEDMGLELHISRNLRPALADGRYVGRPVAVVGDPAGNQRSMVYEESSFDKMLSMGFKAFPAPTNSIDKRLMAVDAMLQRQSDGGPALIIDGTRCPKLVLALQGQYKFLKRRSGQLAPAPDKSHPWSDLADALQYACLVAQGGMTDLVYSRLKIGRRGLTQARPQMSARGWT